MSVSDTFLEFVLDQLEGLGRATAKRMFGGAGLYLRGLFFGILFDDALYLKVDDENRGDFVEAGSKPFRPFPNRPTALQYYPVPEGVLESRARLVEWAERAIAAASRAWSAKTELKAKRAANPRRARST